VFQGGSATSAASSAGASEKKQSAKLGTGTQAYFAYYNPSGWTAASRRAVLDSIARQRDRCRDTQIGTPRCTLRAQLPAARPAWPDPRRGSDEPGHPVVERSAGFLSSGAT